MIFPTGGRKINRADDLRLDRIETAAVPKQPNRLGWLNEGQISRHLADKEVTRRAKWRRIDEEGVGAVPAKHHRMLPKTNAERVES